VIDTERQLLLCCLKEALIKSNSPRSNNETHAAEFDTLRFNQRILNIAKASANLTSGLWRWEYVG